MNNSLENKTVLVTGAARGIGKAIALEAAKQGANVAVADIQKEEVDRTADEISALKRRSLSLRVDVRSAKDVLEMIQKIRDTFQKIDVLFNNAGVVEIHNFLDVTEAEWDLIMDTNAKGAFLVGQNVAKVMAEQKSGVIINTSSVACRKGMSQASIYAASKSVVASLTWSMAHALAPHGIRVNAIAPGMIDTELWEYVDKKSAEVSEIPPGEPKRRRIQTIPMGRPGTAEEVAKVAVFLATDEASYIHGQIVNINGGDFMS